MVDNTPSADEEITAISRELAEFASSFKASIKLSWVLTMAMIQTSIGNVYVQLFGKEKACKRLEDLYTSLQEKFGPSKQAFDDAATLSVPYIQLPQFIMFNAAYSEYVKQLCTKHPTEYVILAQIRLLIDIAASSSPERLGPALGVKHLMQVCRDIKAGYYDICEF
jgi:hypothetical protein